MSKDSHLRELLIGAGWAILVLTISLLAHFNSRFPGDVEITHLFQSIHNGPLLLAMKGISYATGTWKAAVLVIIGSIAVWRCIGLLEGGMVAAAGLASFIDNALKLVINRPRPTPDLVTIYIAETAKSFPSGHSFFAVLVFGMVAYLAIARLNNPGLRALTISVFLILVLWTGSSRIYLGVHWTSDVVGAYIIGGFFLAVLIRLYHVLKPRFAAKKLLGK